MGGLRRDGYGVRLRRIPCAGRARDPRERTRLRCAAEHGARGRAQRPPPGRPNARRIRATPARRAAAGWRSAFHLGRLYRDGCRRLWPGGLYHRLRQRLRRWLRHRWRCCHLEVLGSQPLNGLCDRRPRDLRPAGQRRLDLKFRRRQPQWPGRSRRSRFFRTATTPCRRLPVASPGVPADYVWQARPPPASSSPLRRK